MYIIDEFNVVIYNTDDLAQAVSAGYNFTNIFFGANITLGYGVSINPAKTQLTFDGLYEGVSYSFTDINNLLEGSTLNVWTTSSIAITIRNLTITGRNYYGVPYIREAAGVNNSAVSVTYENVTYNGIQLVFNPAGLTVFNGCNISIAYNGQNDSQEVGEVCRLEFAGTNVINHNSTHGDAAFWFRGLGYNPVMRLRAGAHVTITTNTYFMYNLVASILVPDTPNPVTYELLEGSTLLLNSNHGISLNSSHRVSSFLAGRNSTFRYIQTVANGTNESMYINGAFTAQEGSTVYMQSNFASAYPLIRFRGSTNFNLTDPLSFVIYNSTRPAVVADTGVTVSFNFQGHQLNRWLTATAFPTAGTFDDDNRPQWRKPDWGIFTISGNITPTATSNISSSFTPEELADLPALDTLQLHSAHVIALGDVPIEMDPVVEDGRSISGTSSPNANIRIEYNVEGVDYLIELTADENGRFASGETDPIPAGTSVTIRANTPFLISFISVEVVVVGEIGIEYAPTLIRFVFDPVITAPIPVLPRELPLDPVVIADNRADNSRWDLLLSIDGDMHTAEGSTLPEGVIFTDSVSSTILSGTPITVFTGGPNPGTTNVFWEREQGILLRVTQPIRAMQVYTAEVTWAVVPRED